MCKSMKFLVYYSTRERLGDEIEIETDRNRGGFA